MTKRYTSANRRSASVSSRGASTKRLFSVAEIVRKFHLPSADVEIRATRTGEMTSAIATRIVCDAFKELQTR